MTVHRCSPSFIFFFIFFCVSSRTYIFYLFSQSGQFVYKWDTNVTMCFLVSAHNTYFKAKVPLICNCNLYQPVEAQHKTRDKNAEDADRTMCDFSCVLFPRLVGFHTSLCTNSSKPLLCCNSYAFMCLVGWLQQHLPCLCCTFVVKPINGFMILTAPPPTSRIAVVDAEIKIWVIRIC